MPGTRKLGRTSDSRNAMMRAMVTYLLENGKIETTVTRATAATPASSRSALAAATLLRWQFWSSSDLL